MKTIINTVSILACGAALVAPSVANAEDAQDPYAWQEEGMQSGVGVSTILGGGVIGFTDQTVRDAVATDVAGSWNLRVALGSHTPIAFEAGYLGAAANIDTLTGAERHTLVGTTVEGALRFNVLPHEAWTPYGFAGVGYQRYDITGNLSLADSGMNESDNAIVFPLGAGLAYRDTSGLVIDVRGTFRPTTDNDLVLENMNSATYAPLHAWEASAGLGYEF